jgi:hypothetical protein
MAFEDVTKSIIDKLTTIYNTIVGLSGTFLTKPAADLLYEPLGAISAFIDINKTLADNTTTSIFKINGLSEGTQASYIIEYDGVSISGLVGVTHRGTALLLILFVDSQYYSTINDNHEFSVTNLGGTLLTDTWTVVNTGTETTVRLNMNSSLNTPIVFRARIFKVSLNGTYTAL